MVHFLFLSSFTIAISNYSPTRLVNGTVSGYRRIKLTTISKTGNTYWSTVVSHVPHINGTRGITVGKILISTSTIKTKAPLTMKVQRNVHNSNSREPHSCQADDHRFCISFPSNSDPPVSFEQPNLWQFSSMTLCQSLSSYNKIHSKTNLTLHFGNLDTQ